MGTEWRWEAECLPRAVLVARTLAYGDPSFQRAARVLAETGYAPAVPRLRMVLLDRLAAYKQLMTKRQTYLAENHPQAEKHKRLAKHLRRKMTDMPDSAFKPFTAYIAALLGVIAPNDSHDSEGIQRLQQFFSISALQQRLETIDDPVLLEKYEEAGRTIPSLVPLVLASINLILLPLLRQQLQNAGHETSTLPTRIASEAILENMQPAVGHTLITSNQMIGELRLFLTIFLIAVPAENIALLIQWKGILREIFSQVLDYIGIPPEPMVNLLENANSPSA